MLGAKLIIFNMAYPNAWVWGGCPWGTVELMEVSTLLCVPCGAPTWQHCNRAKMKAGPTVDKRAAPFGHMSGFVNYCRFNTLVLRLSGMAGDIRWLPFKC